jgi:hypothetical protein
VDRFRILRYRCLEVVGGRATPHHEVDLDSRSAEMSVDDRLRRLEPAALAGAIEQLVLVFHCAWETG